MLKVLVVDDDITMRELLYDTLTRKGYEVLTAASGSQALELLRTQRTKAILLDTVMPGLSGLETAKQIREFDDDVAIVLLADTGDSAMSSNELEQVGVTDVLHKKLGVKLFLSSVERILNHTLPGQPRSPDVAPGRQLSGTVLVVDDDHNVQQFLKVFLESKGFRVIVASSGEEALQTLAHKPAIVLLDIQMPGMDGLVTLKKIKASSPRLPIIMASGVGEEATIREALKAGAYDYITKPFNLEYMETVVMTKLLLGIEGEPSPSA